MTGAASVSRALKKNLIEGIYAIVETELWPKIY